MVAVVLLALVGCSSAPPPVTSRVTTPPTAAAAGNTPATPRLGPDGRPFVVSEVARFDEPWAMTFLPDGDLLVTQRTGELLLRESASGRVVPVAGTPRVSVGGQGGLGDVVLGPTFGTDRAIYLSWAEAGDAGTSGAAVGRATLVRDAAGVRLDGLSVIWRQQPKVTGQGHFSHRLAFSPDGRFLFVTSGERQKLTPAQDLSTNLGKVLRLNPDGTPAAGNPFVNRGGVAAEIWSYGHRNVLGIAFDAGGNLWVSEMGPMGGDEVNLILPGRNYGWPSASNGSNYDGTDIPDHTPGDGFGAPKVWWTPSVSPSSLIAYTGAAFPGWQGDLFAGALSGQALLRVDVQGQNAVKGDEWDMGARVREVEQGPDGTLWLLQDAPDGRLLHLVPVGW